jgi:hypothetical protein
MPGSADPPVFPERAAAVGTVLRLVGEFAVRQARLRGRVANLRALVKAGCATADDATRMQVAWLATVALVLEPLDLIPADVGLSSGRQHEPPAEPQLSRV